MTEGKLSVKWLTNWRKDEVAKLPKHLRWQVFGEPKATERYSVAELRAMGMVGIYRVEQNALKVLAEVKG